MSSSKLPPELEELKQSLEVGQMIPVCLNGSKQSDRPFLAFMIRETDQVVSEAQNNPVIEASVGQVKNQAKDDLRFLYFLVRMAHLENDVYETVLSNADEFLSSMLDAAHSQKAFALIFCGDEKNAVVNVENELFHAQLDASIDVLKERYQSDWNKDILAESMNDLQQSAKTPYELWSLFEKNEGFLEITQLPN